MILLFLLILIALLIADLFDKKIEDTIPVVIFSLLIILFGVALLGKSHRYFEGSIALFVLVWGYYFVKKKRIFPKPAILKEKLLSPAFILYVCVIVLMYFLYSNHIITVWDDYHYNATFPKDMYMFGTMPTGTMSATYYKSYLPLMQLFFYLGFQWQGYFSEHLMFFYKAVLVYTCMLPLMKGINDGKLSKRIITGVLSVVLPYAFMFEMLESLSMDSFMAGLFGYALTVVLFDNNKDAFSYTKILVSLCSLTLVKQIAPIFSCIVLGTWFVYETVLCISKKKVIIAEGEKENQIEECVDKKCNDKEYKKTYLKNIVMMLVTASICGAGYLAWKIFCNIKGNSVYLSGKLMDSVEGGGFLPDYGMDTIVNFLKSIFTLNLNLSSNGLTLFFVVLLVAICLLIINGSSGSKNEVSELNDEDLSIRNMKKAKVYGFGVILLGLLGYLAVLLYTYIFVFEQWEAESLSSIDRYFGTYALALMMVLVYALLEKCAFIKKAEYALLVVFFVVLVTLPWKNMYNELIPANYMVTKATEYNDYMEAKDEVAMVHPESLETKVVMFVSNEGNSIYSRSSEYFLLPHVPVELEVYEDMGDVSQELLEKCNHYDAYYVYFSGRLIDDDTSKGQIVNALEEGALPKRGIMYYYDKDANVIRELD